MWIYVLQRAALPVVLEFASLDDAQDAMDRDLNSGLWGPDDVAYLAEVLERWEHVAF